MSGDERRHLDQALRYARFGWRVFPCMPGGKMPAIPADQGGHGVKDATCDPDQIRGWWARNPARNVAIATGWPGPDVLDIDRHGDASGFPALRELRTAGLVGQPGRVIRTPSGGLHLYFRGSQQGNGTVRGKHIDFRGEGGYVIAPPSTVAGRPYVVVDRNAEPDRIDWGRVREYLDPQPERRAWATPPGGQQQNLDHLVRMMATQGSGNRNQFLFWAACRAFDHGQPAVVEQLAEAAAAAGLTPREVQRTIDSASHTARQDPHTTDGRTPARRPIRAVVSRPGPATGCAGPDPAESGQHRVTARPGDLVVAARTASGGPNGRVVYDVGVVTRTGPDGRVTAYLDSRGATQPVALLSMQPPWMRLVSQDAIDVDAAREVARDSGPFWSPAQAAAALQPLSRQPQAEMEAGS